MLVRKAIVSIRLTISPISRLLPRRLPMRSCRRCICLRLRNEARRSACTVVTTDSTIRVLACNCSV